jgi:hypothetical protein
MKQVASKPGSCWFLSSLKIEAKCYGETAVDTGRYTWRYISEYGTLHNNLCESLQSYRTWLLQTLKLIYLCLYMNSKITLYCAVCG